MKKDIMPAMDFATQHTLHLTELLSDLMLFFGIAGLVVPFLQRVRLSPVLAYLLCGVAIGPFGLGLFVSVAPWLKPLSIENPETVQMLGELGIIALLFMIGLEMSFRRLRELRHYVLGLGGLQIMVSAALIALIASFFDNSIAAAILLGASLALSSTAIVMQLLGEKHLINRPLGILSFSILLMQDLAVVPILILASAFAGDGEQSLWITIAHSMLIAFVSVAGIYMIGKRLLRPLMNTLRFTHNPEWLVSFVLFMVVAVSAVTQIAGLSAALGAFLAGLLIAETEFRHEIEVIIEPLKSLLLGIFFLSIGMMIDVREVLNNPYWIAISVIGICVVKAAIIYPLARGFKVGKNYAAQAAVILAPPGEFAFLILSVAMASAIMPADHGQFFLLITATSMLLAPGLFKLAPHIGRWVSHESADEVRFDAYDDGAKPHVIIAGFGRIGMMIGGILEKQMIPYVAIDRDPALVRKAQMQRYNVMYGDVKRVEQWRKMRADTAAAVVIAIDEPEVSKDILRTLRRHWPQLPVMMRAKDITDIKHLYDAGAKLVVPEALESSLQLARAVMGEVGIEEQKLDEIIAVSRKQATLPEE